MLENALSNSEEIHSREDLVILFGEKKKADLHTSGL